MPGHRAAFTRHMKTHRQLSSHQCDGIGSFRKRKGNGVALYRLAGGDRDARLATKRHRLIGARYHGRTAPLKADKHTVESDRLRAQRIGKAQTRVCSPDIWTHDQAEGLIACPVSAEGNAMRKSGCADGFPTGYGP